MVAVTGLGVISSLGNSIADNRQALIQGVSGLTSLQLFATKYADQLKFGEIKISNAELIQTMGVTANNVTRTSLLALNAAIQSIEDSGLTLKEIQSADTALIIGNTVGGMCLTDELYQDSNRKSKGSPFVTEYDCGSVTVFLQKHFGIKGVCNTINTACSSSSNAIMYGARLIENGFAKRAIVGGVDSLSKFTINGFNALGILSSDKCKPFDTDRNGLNLGEGAGFLVLERSEDILRKNTYAILSGYCNSNDAFHPSSLSEDGIGPTLAMKGALKKVGLNPHDIGYINTHGTGTQNNDEVESRAMINVFKEVPDFASTKSKIGHTLGGSAAIEAVFTIMALSNQEIYASLGFTSPIEGTGLKPLLSYKKHVFQHAMANSFGFGGNCSSLVFSKFNS